MTPHLELEVTALGVAAAANFGLALLVLRYAPRREENRVFALLAGLISLWAGANALFRLATSPGWATLWAQLAYACALFIAAAFLHFAFVYPRRLKVGKRDKATLWLLAALLSLFSFVPNLVVEGVDLQGRRILTAPGLYLLALYMGAIALYGFALFYANQGRLRQRERAQARYVLYGLSLTAAPGLFFNLALPLLGDYRWVWLGPLASLLFVGCCAYSIIAHRLFDVRLLIRRTLVYAALLSLLAASFPAIEQALERLLKPLLGGGDSLRSDLLAALAVSLLVEPLKRRLQQLTEKLFQNEATETGR